MIYNIKNIGKREELTELVDILKSKTKLVTKLNELTNKLNEFEKDIKMGKIKDPQMWETLLSFQYLFLIWGDANNGNIPGMINERNDLLKDTIASFYKSFYSVLYESYILAILSNNLSSNTPLEVIIKTMDDINGGYNWDKIKDNAPDYINKMLEERLSKKQEEKPGKKSYDELIGKQKSVDFKISKDKLKQIFGLGSSVDFKQKGKIKELKDVDVKWHNTLMNKIFENVKNEKMGNMQNYLKQGENKTTTKERKVMVMINKNLRTQLTTTCKGFDHCSDSFWVRRNENQEEEEKQLIHWTFGKYDSLSPMDLRKISEQQEKDLENIMKNEDFKDSVAHGKILENLGDIYYSLKNYDKAKEKFENAMKVYSKNYENDDLTIMKISSKIAFVEYENPMTREKSVSEKSDSDKLGLNDIIKKLKESKKPLLALKVVEHRYKINMFNRKYEDAFNDIKEHYDWVTKESDYEGQYGFTRRTLLLKMAEAETELLKTTKDNKDNNDDIHDKFNSILGYYDNLIEKHEYLKESTVTLLYKKAQLYSVYGDKINEKPLKIKNYKSALLNFNIIYYNYMLTFGPYTPFIRTLVVEMCVLQSKISGKVNDDKIMGLINSIKWMDKDKCLDNIPYVIQKLIKQHKLIDGGDDDINKNKNINNYKNLIKSYSSICNWVKVKDYALYITSVSKKIKVMNTKK